MAVKNTSRRPSEENLGKPFFKINKPKKKELRKKRIKINVKTGILSRAILVATKENPQKITARVNPA